MTSRQWTILEVCIEAKLLNSETPEEVSYWRRRAAVIRRRWRNRELVDYCQLDLGGEA